MKKLFSIFIIITCMMPVASMAAVTIKKAAPVAAKQTDKMASATSLLPTVIGLVGSVKSLSAQQQQLSSDCAPTSDEVNTVNSLVKEWAKIGDTNAGSAVSGLGDEPCSADKNNSGGAYERFLEDHDDGDTCYETFSASADEKTVWEGFPKVSSGKKCDENGKNCKYMSNIYDVFARIPFADEDLTKSELSKITKLKEKSERCAPGKINAAKRELYGNFLVQTLGSVGQTTGAAGTGSVLEAVSSMGGSGNIKSMLPSLGSMATQMLDK